MSDGGSDRNSFRRMSSEMRFLSWDHPGMEESELWDKSSSMMVFGWNDGSEERVNSFRDVSMSDTALLAILLLLARDWLTHSDPASFGNFIIDDADASPELSCASSLKLEILAAIRT